MKIIIKIKVVFFICNFLGFLVFIILMFKFFDFKQMGSFSWGKIGQYLPLYIIGSLVFAAWMTWSGVGDSLIEFFADRVHCKKRRKNEK